MKKSFWKLPLLMVLLLLMPGCVSLGLEFSPSLIPHLTQASFEECDLQLAEESLPAELKLMEGLLKSAPDNKRLLTALSMGFTGYAMLFVEEVSPERASHLYLRAKNYGLRAMGRSGSLLKEGGQSNELIRTALGTTGKEELEPLFWTTMSWNAWINLNLDKPTALAQLAIAESCLERVLQLKGDYFYGTPYVLMGTILAAKPKMLGGDPAKAKEYFEKAISLTNGKFLLAQYYFARHYAVRVQDKALFNELISQVDKARPDDLKEVCLINAVMKQKTKRLKEMSEELFF